MRIFTKKSRWMLYLALFITGLLFFTSLFYFINVENTTQEPPVIIIILIILIGILAVVSIFIKRFKLRKNTSSLSDSYFDAYEEISDKFQGTAMSSMEKKETLADILDLFLLANENGRDVVEVIGEDVDGFITQIQASFGYRSKLLFNFLSGIQYSVMYLVLLQGSQIVKYYKTVTFYNIEIGISAILYLVPLAFLGIPLMTHFIRKNKMLWVILILVSILGLFIGAMETMNAYFSHVPIVKTILDGQMKAIPNLGALIFWIGLILLASLFKIVQRKSSIARL